MHRGALWSMTWSEEALHRLDLFFLSGAVHWVLGSLGWVRVVYVENF